MDVRLVLPFDASAAARRAAALVASYAGAVRPAVTLLNVQPRPLSPWPDALVAGTVDEALRAEGREALRAGLEQLPGADASVRLGSPADAIVTEAGRLGAAAILMGTRGSGALHGFAMGSVALRVAHAAPVPTLLVKPEARLPGAFGRRLRAVVAMDGSEPAQRAARQLAAWREWLGMLEVHLVHVQQPLTLLETILPPHRDVIEQWSTRAGEEAAQAARELFTEAGIAHRLHLTVGEPAREICLLAEQTGAELVALGTRGLGAAHHALIGSVALKAAAASEVPVLLVR